MKEIRDIRLKLKRWGIKQQWLADRLGVNKATLSLWLSETNEMPDDKIKQAQDELNIIPMPE